MDLYHPYYIDFYVNDISFPPFCESLFLHRRRKGKALHLVLGWSPFLSDDRGFFLKKRKKNLIRKDMNVNLRNWFLGVGGWLLSLSAQAQQATVLPPQGENICELSSLDLSKVTFLDVSGQKVLGR